MRNIFLPFSKPSITEDDIAAVGDVLRSGWITTGPKNAEFEKNFCEYTGAPNSVALASATGGMHILFKALGLKEGDEVITPSMTWVSTVNMICLAGAVPIFADVDKDTLLLKAETVEKLITPRTKLIIPVHFAGAPVDLDPIFALAAKHGIKVVEDAAHAVGTFYKGKHVGHRGTSLFSFHPIKNITSGEGGMFCTDDKELADHIRRLKFHGLGADAYDRKTQGRSPHAEVLEPGFKYNLTDIAAVLGVRQLARLDEFNKKRAVLTKFYSEKFASVEEIKPLKDPSGYDFVHARHLFIVRVDSPKISRDLFMEKLKAENIGTGLHFRAAHTHKYYRENFKIEKGSLDNTNWNSEKMCSIPLFPDMTPEDVEDVVTAIKKVLADA